MLEFNGTNKKEVLIDDIKNMKSGSYEEMWLITVYGLSSYFKSLFSFGFNSNVTKDNINENDQHPLLRKYMEEYSYLVENNHIRNYIKELLNDHLGYNIRNIIKEDMISWKDLCLKEYQKDIIPNKYITKSHIIELTKKTEEIFKTFII